MVRPYLWGWWRGGPGNGKRLYCIERTGFDGVFMGAASGKMEGT